MAADTPAKTTNCRICQPFGGAYQEKARREATGGRSTQPDRARAVLSDSSGIKIPLGPTLS